MLLDDVEEDFEDDELLSAEGCFIIFVDAEELLDESELFESDEFESFVDFLRLLDFFFLLSFTLLSEE